jgi:hypothetical protein
MKQRRTWSVGLLFLFTLATGGRLQAQGGDQGKPPVYTYISEWAVPRAEWADMVKLDDQDKPLLDKLVADGTLTSYGAYTNLIHQEGEPTHGTWLTATSEGNILKALEAIYAQPGTTTARVQADSKHWDYFMVSRMYNQRSGKSDAGYLGGDVWQVKPGQMRAYNDLAKTELVPVLEKLIADGTLTAYGMATEDFHTAKLGQVTFYFTTPDAASFDKAGKAIDDAFDKNPALIGALQSMTDREGHRDFLDRLRYMNNK